MLRVLTSEIIRLSEAIKLIFDLNLVIQINIGQTLVILTDNK